MSIVRIGSTQKFAENWDSIFGGKKSKAAPKSANKKAGGKKKKSAVKAGKKK